MGRGRCSHRQSGGHEVLTCVNRETGVETFSIATDDGEAFYWEKGMFWWNERDGKFDTYRPAAVEGCISYRQDTGS